MVEIIPKKEERAASWQRIIFYSLVTVLVGMLGFYAFLYFDFKEAKNQHEELEAQLGEVEQEETIKLESKVISYKQRIEEIAPLVQEHVVNSKAFEFLEGQTHPEVFFTDVYVKPREAMIDLRGVTNSFPSLGQQLTILKRNPEVREVGLSNVGITDTGEVNFFLNLTLNKNLFRY